MSIYIYDRRRLTDYRKWVQGLIDAGHVIKCCQCGKVIKEVMDVHSFLQKDTVMYTNEECIQHQTCFSNRTLYRSRTMSYRQQRYAEKQRQVFATGNPVTCRFCGEQIKSINDLYIKTELKHENDFDKYMVHKWCVRQVKKRSKIPDNVKNKRAREYPDYDFRKMSEIIRWDKDHPITEEEEIQFEKAFQNVLDDMESNYHGEYIRER